MWTDEHKPYSKLKIICSYLSYYLRAESKHGVHSPTVFHFASNVISAAKKVRYKDIEKERERLVASKQEIDFTDFGKGGGVFRKKIAHIAKYSLKPKKYAQLLAAVATDLKPKSILEMGTSLGITTAYLANSVKNTQVLTLEGDTTVAGIAQNIWNQLGISNITCKTGDFEKHIVDIATSSYDIIYIDGNHKKEPTLRYFERLMANSKENTLFIFDDIHYSKSMEQAWESIKNHKEVTTTIDVFFLGFVHIDKSLSKQHFTLRY